MERYKVLFTDNPEYIPLCRTYEEARREGENKKRAWGSYKIVELR